MPLQYRGRIIRVKEFPSGIFINEKGIPDQSVDVSLYDFEDDMSESDAEESLCSGDDDSDNDINEEERKKDKDMKYSTYTCNRRVNAHGDVVDIDAELEDMEFTVEDDTFIDINAHGDDEFIPSDEERESCTEEYESECADHDEGDIEPEVGSDDDDSDYHSDEAEHSNESASCDLSSDLGIKSEYKRVQCDSTHQPEGHTTITNNHKRKKDCYWAETVPSEKKIRLM